MKKILFFLLLAVLCLGPSLVLGQTVDLILLNTNATIFIVGDIDFANLGNAPNFFQLFLSGNQNQDMLISLDFEIKLNNQTIVTAKSNRVTLPMQSQNIFTNEQLNAGLAPMRDQTGASTGEFLELGDFDVDLEIIPNLQQQVTQTGKLPSGVYNVLVKMNIIEQGSISQTINDNNPGNNTYTITNPTTLELLFPGNQVGAGIIPEVPTPFPPLYYQSDASLFNLYVYKKEGDESIQDVLSHDPHLHLEGYPNQIFQYPSDPEPLEIFNQNGERTGRSVGFIRPLEPGGIYYWFVESVIQTASGTTILKSDVFQFKVADREQVGSEANLIMIYLRQILGERYEDYQRALQGYEPTGRIYLNNVEITTETMIELISRLNQQSAIIENITIE